MTRAYIGLVCAVLWLLLGVAALLAHVSIATAIGEAALVWPAVVIYSLSSGAASGNVSHGLLWDSAHGPPFLTVPGVVILYLVPGVWGIVIFLRSRARYSGPAA